MTVVGLSRSDVRGQILYLVKQDHGFAVEIDGVADDLGARSADDVVGGFFAALGVHQVPAVKTEDGAVGG